jgi:uncharacterized membrane protein
MDQPKKVGHSRALHCFVINQFATPGLGSILAGRLLAGIGQLIVAVVGFVLVLIWFFMTLKQYYGQILSDAPVKSYARYGEIGGVVFIVSWIWAWFTSFSIVRNAKPDEKTGLNPVPPRIPPPQNPTQA